MALVPRVPWGGVPHIFIVRGRAIGKCIYFPDIGIKKDLNFHNFGIRNGADFQNFGVKSRGVGAICQGGVCGNPGFGCGFHNPSSFGHPFHVSRMYRNNVPV